MAGRSADKQGSLITSGVLERRAEIPEGSHPCKLRGWLEAHKQTHPHTHNEKEVNKRGERCTGGLDNHDTRWHHRNTNFKTSQCNFRKQLLCLVFISSMTVPLTESSPWGWNPLFPNVFSSCLKNQDVSNSSPQFNGYMFYIQNIVKTTKIWFYNPNSNCTKCVFSFRSVQ